MRNSAGNYTATFDERFPQIDSMTGTVQTTDVATEAWVVQFGVFDQTAKTLVVSTWEVAGTPAATDLTADPDHSVNVRITVRDTNEERY